MQQLIVAIDGPGGTGKSSVSRAVASRIGIPHLDTGAFYRAATLGVIRAGLDPEDASGVSSLVDRLEMDQDGGRTFLNDEDVTEEIRGSEVTTTVSRVSAIPEVRRTLVRRQREWVERHGRRAVVEGRDIGSVVFPEATIKFYLDASPEVRAGRRAMETGEDHAQVLSELTRRDRFDSTRPTSPLQIPDDAIVVDTSELTFDEVVDRVLHLIPAKS